MSDSDFSVRNRLNRGDPNVLGPLLQKCRMGDVLGRLAADPAVEETLAVTDGNAVLGRRALVLYAVYATTGNYTGPLVLVPPSIATASKAAQLGTDRKTLGLASADGITEIRVLYLAMPDGLEAVLGNPLGL